MPIRLTIIGSGPGGYVAAVRAAQKGAQVTIIEQAEVGGVCLNQGCIPTKTLLASAQALEKTRSAADFGVVVEGRIGYNLERVRERKDKVLSTQRKGIRGLFASWGVELIEGRGSILSPGVVRAVGKDGAATDIVSDRIIIATGSRPAKPPVYPFDGERVITSDEAVQFRNIPKSLLIIGAGVIGSEFAFIYNAFGTEVTMAELTAHAVATEDEDMSRIIEREMKKAKIKLITGVRVEGVEKSGGLVAATLSNGMAVNAEMVLVSIGRELNTKNLGLDELGMHMGKRGEVAVNERMETSVPGVYAVGDVTGNMMLAHVASRQGLVAVENALGGDARMDYTAVPCGIFTAPEIGSVGLRERQAVEKGIAYRVGRFQFRGLGKAHVAGELVGMAKIIADQATDRVLGVHICGAHATDLIHEGALAMHLGATARQLGNMIHAHPTMSEALMEAAEDAHGTAIHVPKPGK